MATYRLFFVGYTGDGYRHTGVVHCANDERARANAATLLRSNKSCLSVHVRQDERVVAWITRTDLEPDASAGPDGQG